MEGVQRAAGAAGACGGRAQASWREAVSQIAVRKNADPKYSPDYAKHHFRIFIMFIKASNYVPSNYVPLIIFNAHCVHTLCKVHISKGTNV